MKPKMTILFIGKKSRTTKHQLLPIYLRVTIEGERFEVATHRHTKLSDWSPSEVPHLTSEELKALEEKEITISRLDLLRDMFLFSCYTGFAYVDVACLTTEHIKIGADGEQWLIKNRKKTDISERVPMLPPVEKILNKYAHFSRKVKGDNSVVMAM